MSLIELFYFLKNITNSKSKLILKNNKPVKIPIKYQNLSEVAKISYTVKEFEKDIIQEYLFTQLDHIKKAPP